MGLARRGRPIPDPSQEWHYFATSAEWNSFILLFHMLDHAQRRSLLNFGYFEVVSSQGHTYEIYFGRDYNVVRRNGKFATHRYCAVPLEGVPTWDAMLAQKLYLEADPEYFLAKANRRFDFGESTVSAFEGVVQAQRTWLALPESLRCGVSKEDVKKWHVVSNALD